MSDWLPLKAEVLRWICCLLYLLFVVFVVVVFSFPRRWVARPGDGAGGARRAVVAELPSGHTAVVLCPDGSYRPPDADPSKGVMVQAQLLHTSLPT